MISYNCYESQFFRNLKSRFQECQMMNGVIRVEDIHVEFRDSKIQDDKSECTTIPASSKQLNDKIRSKNEPLSFCNPIAADSIYSEFRNTSEDENKK